jgi:hypothetical protein
VDSEPEIWRSFAISNQVTLATLHAVLQIVMGWENAHLYAFKVGGQRYAAPCPQPLDGTLDATAVTLASLKLEPDSQFSYLYDFGDGWVHQVTLVEVEPLTNAAELPTCLDGDRACPPEDAGGIWGYESLLERLADPEDPNYEELLEWLIDFDPEQFDIAAVNRQLRATFG